MAVELLPVLTENEYFGLRLLVSLDVASRLSFDDLCELGEIEENIQETTQTMLHKLLALQLVKEDYDGWYTITIQGREYLNSLKESQ